MTTVCPHCGWPDDQPFQTMSRHTTGHGLTVWVRCACGSVQVREVDAAGVRVLSRGRPTPDGDPRGCRA